MALADGQIKGNIVPHPDGDHDGILRQRIGNNIPCAISETISRDLALSLKTGIKECGSKHWRSDERNYNRLEHIQGESGKTVVQRNMAAGGSLHEPLGSQKRKKSSCIQALIVRDAGWQFSPARPSCAGMARIFVLLLVLAVNASAGTVRIVASNLTSGNHQTYSPDNGNHSNPEGAGARILQGLRPDIVLIQEFNTSIPARQWVNATFGQEFSFYQEANAEIPNGIISRFPILESGEWIDPEEKNRDFVWARIALPDGSRILAISVHLSAKKSSKRATQAHELARLIQEKIKPGERTAIGGDFNLHALSEEALAELGKVVAIPSELPSDASGNSNTNSPRNNPYDWVLVDPATQKACRPVRLAGLEFSSGLVFDSRVFAPLASVPPVQAGDSATPQMQHMAVVRDFELSP